MIEVRLDPFMIHASKFAFISSKCIAKTYNKKTALVDIKELKDNLEKIDFNYTRRIGIKELEENIEIIESELQNDSDDLIDNHYARIEKSVAVIGTIMQEEMNDFPLFTTIDNKKFKISDLQSNALSIVGEDTFKKLPILSQIDFAEGCKCLAFECHTASAFHILRSVEGLLNKIHLEKVESSGEKMTWGKLIHSLKDNKCISDQQFRHLDYIRDLYRNPTNHPEKQYSSSEAENLLALCVEVLNVMSVDLPDEILLDN